MSDRDCVELLQWALPKLGLRWKGFSNVRGQVCKRIARRSRALGLTTLAAYRAHLEESPDEWRELETLCRVTISRFYRDRGVWQLLSKEIDERAAERSELRAWSIGCGAGEEPYTLSIVWELEILPRHPGAQLAIIANDIDAHQLERARRAVYPEGALRELPAQLRRQAFEVCEDEQYRLLRRFRERVELELLDVKRERASGVFDLVLCRNIGFTYFDLAAQRELLHAIEARLRPRGLLVLGRHEQLPEQAMFSELAPGCRVYAKVGPRSS